MMYTHAHSGSPRPPFLSISVLLSFPKAYPYIAYITFAPPAGGMDHKKSFLSKRLRSKAVRQVQLLEDVLSLIAGYLDQDLLKHWLQVNAQFHRLAMARLLKHIVVYDEAKAERMKFRGVPLSSPTFISWLNFMRLPYRLDPKLIKFVDIYTGNSSTMRQKARSYRCQYNFRGDPPVPRKPSSMSYWQKISGTNQLVPDEKNLYKYIRRLTFKGNIQNIFTDLETKKVTLNLEALSIYSQTSPRFRFDVPKKIFDTSKIMYLRLNPHFVHFTTTFDSLRHVLFLGYHPYCSNVFLQSLNPGQLHTLNVQKAFSITSTSIPNLCIRHLYIDCDGPRRPIYNNLLIKERKYGLQAPIVLNETEKAMIRSLQLYVVGLRNQYFYVSRHGTHYVLTPVYQRPKLANGFTESIIII